MKKLPHSLFSAILTGLVCILPVTRPITIKLLPLIMVAIGSLPLFINAARAQIWTQTGAPLQSWSSIASSADGTRLAAGGQVSGGNSTFVSTNAGLTWTESLTNGGGQIISSTNGSKLVLTQPGFANLYISTNGGVSWQTPTPPQENLQATAGSWDGSKLVTVANSDFDGNSGHIFRSTDSGTTWTQLNATTNAWWAVASSADGTKLVAAANQDMEFNPGGSIYYSTDSGTTWNLSDAPAYTWVSVAASGDGTRLVAVASDDGAFNGVNIYISSNSGAHWTPVNGTSNMWLTAACSADGSRMYALGTPQTYDEVYEELYESTNFGTNWSIATTLPPDSFVALAASADGSKLVAPTGSGGIYTTALSTPWTLTSAPNTNYWGSLAASSDGTKWLAGSASENSATTGPLYRSIDSTANWSVTGPTSIWNSVASSADGKTLLAVGPPIVGSGIYVSTNSGTTWQTNNLPQQNWFAGAASSDGTKLVVMADGFGSDSPGLVYTSTNSGGSWNQSTGAPSEGWVSVASSADGTELVAAVNGNNTYSGAPYGYIFTSPDSGVTWNPTSAPQIYWSAVACSADGTKLVAAPYENIYLGPVPIYTSTNSGTTWVTNNTPSEHWVTVASSADGTRLAAATANGLLYYSTNSGAIWTSTSTPFQQWQAVAWSGSGNRLVGASFYGGIYELPFGVASAPPVLNINASASQAFLTWLTNNSTGYTLQQNTNLVPVGWLAVTNLPLVTNQLYQVTVPITNRQDFFRLISP